MTVKVSLDTTKNPPVTVKPSPENVNRGNQTITWVPEANQPPFAFNDVQFLTTPNPFSAPTITNGPAKMTVTENNTATADFPYTISVILNGKVYSSAGSQKGGVGNGTPVIHNN